MQSSKLSNNTGIYFEKLHSLTQTKNSFGLRLDSALGTTIKELLLGTNIKFFYNDKNNNH